jgi:hypothetical protein
MRGTLVSQKLTRHSYKCLVGKSQWNEATSVVDDGIIAHKECVMAGTAPWRPRIMVVFYKTAMILRAPEHGIHDRLTANFSRKILCQEVNSIIS